MGTSNFRESTQNAINVLVGVGILSLPFAFKTVGWIFGFGFLIAFMLLTNYTARIVAKCLDYDPLEEMRRGRPCSAEFMHNVTRENPDAIVSNYGATQSLLWNKDEFVDDAFTSENASTRVQTSSKRCLMSYSDIGEAAFKRKGRLFISLVFTLELFAAAVALIILIADSLKALFPEVNLIALKFIAFLAVAPTMWLKNLKLLSYASIIGIITVINLIFVVLYDGFSYTETPGSLIHPAPTDIWPPNFMQIPIAFGLVLAGFAGHAVFPNIYREMKQPEKFPRMLNIAYVSTFILYGCMAAFGYFMFGHATQDEITKNIASVPGYNKLVNKFTVWLIAINPFTKFALTLQPVATSFEAYMLRKCTGDSNGKDDTLHIHIRNRSIPFPFYFIRLLLRTVLAFIVFLIAVIFPGFERVIGLLGSLFSMIVSAVFPLACYLKLYSWRMSSTQWYFNVSLLVISIAIGTIGTLWTFLPSDVVGIHSRSLTHQ